MGLKAHKSMTPIGIDFDYNEFRAIQFELNEPLVPKAIATLPRVGRREILPSVDELFMLAQVLAQRGFVGSRVALGVPKECSSFHILDLPPEGSGAPIQRLALLEVQRSGAHKSDDLQIGYWCDRSAGGQNKTSASYFTVACETSPLDELVDRFEAAHFVPVSIEPVETALTRTACNHDEFVEDSIHSIIEIGWDHSWTVITLGSTPVYSRRIDYGTSRVRRQFIDDHAMPVHAMNTLLNPHHNESGTETQVDRIISTLLAPMLTQIVEQLDASLTYVSQQYRFAPFGVALRSGYFSGLDQTAHAVAKRTGMPTLPMAVTMGESSTKHAGITPFEFQQSPRLNIAAGLAIGAAA